MASNEELRNCNGDIEQINTRHVTKRRLTDEQNDGNYLIIENRDDWPENIEQVYLDGNNMMFVVDSLRRLCLNRNRKKTERAIAEIAATWNEQMQIANVDLIFDSTRQLDSVGSVRVSSAQPQYKTTDDMLIEIARRNQNQRTVVVTSDRALSAQLTQQGCLIVKSYQWFAHCVMVLAPELIAPDDGTPKSKTARYNFDEFVRRIVKLDS